MPGIALYIAFDVYPRPKGASSHIEAMLEALAGEFETVHALCLGDQGMAASEKNGRVFIHRLLAGQPTDFLARLTAFAQFVAAQTDRLGPQVRLIVFRDPWGGAAAMRSSTAPAIFEVNALPSWELGYSRPTFLESPTLAAKLGDLERQCLSRAATVLCVSAVTRRALEAEGVAPSKLRVIPNSAPTAFSTAATLPCPVPALQDGRRWIGYIGGLQPWQGVESLIDAFALIAPGHPDARLIIVHSGSRDLRPLSQRIAQRGLSSRVLLHDPLSTLDAAATIARMRCTVAPLADTPRNTHQGCCPIKIVESMAVGTPVVATDLAVCRELIRHGEDGWLAPKADLRALAAGLNEMLTNAPLRDRLAAGAARTAHERFARSNTLIQLRSVFRQIAAAGTMEADSSWQAV